MTITHFSISEEACVEDYITSSLFIGKPDGSLFMYTRDDSRLGRVKPAYLSVLRGTNDSCVPQANLTRNCIRSFLNTTDSITGRIDGLPSSFQEFDVSQRPWYVKSSASTEFVQMSGKKGTDGMYGAIWSDIYLFSKVVSTPTLGMTASRQIRTADGEFLGVAGADYELSRLNSV